MNLLRIGHRVLNLDNVTSVNLAFPCETSVRVFFVGGTNDNLSWTEFKGEEAEELRGYFGYFADTPAGLSARDRELREEMNRRFP